MVYVVVGVSRLGMVVVVVIKIVVFSVGLYGDSFVLNICFKKCY